MAVVKLPENNVVKILSFYRHSVFAERTVFPSGLRRLVNNVLTVCRFIYKMDTVYILQGIDCFQT